MGKSMHVRLVAYEPFGRRLGVLPEPVSFSASIVHNDDGALNLTYSKLAKDGDIIGRNLEQGLEIAVEVSDGGPYVEPDNARYLVIGRSGDQMDPTGTITIDSAPSISWLFSKILNNDTSHLVQDGDNKGKRAFLSSNAGTILKTMLDENRGRGGSAAGLTLGFDTAKDAAGAKWAKVYTLYYSLGVSMQSALSSLVGGGAVDWRTSGRAMKVWNADSANLSRELDGKVILRLSKDVTEAPYEESISELASDILVEGDNGLVFRMDNPAAPKPWGKWETYVSQGGVSDEGTARAFMDATLQDAARVRGQYTRGVNIADAPVLPLIDYHPGDWITAPTVNHGEKVRIQEIDLSMEQGGALTASLALNDIRYDSQVKANKKLQGITGGATLAGSEGGRPAPEQDHRVPKKPLGVVASSDAYIDETGQAHGVAFVGWGEVTQATNDTSIEIDHYEVQYQRTTDRSGYWRSGATATELKCSFGRLDCGGTIRIRVRAIPTYSDRPGEWSDVVSLVVASDVTPPSVPSKPILTSKLGVVEVRSDGKNSVGGGFEPDTSHLIVGRSESDGNWVEVGTLVVGGVYTQIGLTLEHTYWFALRSIDYSGNKSAWSAGSSVKVDPAVSQADLNTLGDKVLAEAKADTKAQVDKVNTALADTNKKVSSNAEGVTAAKQAAADAKKATETNAANIAKSQAAADAAKTQSDSNKKLLESQGKQIEANESGIAAANTRVEQVRSELTEKVTEAQSSADGKSSIWRQSTEPKSERLKPGDLWYRTQEYWTRWKGEPNNSPSLCANFYTFWKGEPNNSPSVLVPLEDRIVEVLMWNGSAWGQFNLVASNVLATGTVDARLINADDVYAITIQGGQFITANGRLKLTDAGIVGKDATGNTTLAYDSSNGSVSLRGAINSGSTMTGTTITGSTFKTTNGRIVLNDTGLVLKNAANTATFTLRSSDGGVVTTGAVMSGGSLTGATVNAGTLNIVSASFYRTYSGGKFSNNYGHINSSGMTLGDKLAYDAAKGTLTLKGPVQSGGDISGATVTGGIVQTTAAASRGVKLTSGGLVGYGNDGGAKFVLHTGDYQVSGVTYPAGSLELNGGVWSNGGINSPTVNAGVFTGPVIRSSASSYPRFELNSGSIRMWDSSRNLTVNLDGNGKNNLLTGTFQTALSGPHIRIAGSKNIYWYGTDGKQAGYFGFTGGESNKSMMWGVDGPRDDNVSRSSITMSTTDEERSAAMYITDNESQVQGWIGAASAGGVSIYSRDSNGAVGLDADINTGYLYLRGFAGVYTGGRSTFCTAYLRGGKISDNHWMTQSFTYSVPAKYGTYHAHVSADSLGSVAVGSNCDSASGCGIWTKDIGNTESVAFGHQLLAVLAAS